MESLRELDDLLDGQAAVSELYLGDGRLLRTEDLGELDLCHVAGLAKRTQAGSDFLP
jgi:hypothetical protein